MGAVYQQTQRWLKAEVFETMAHDLRELVRLTQPRTIRCPAVRGFSRASDIAIKHHAEDEVNSRHEGYKVST